MHPEIARARRALEEGRTADARAVLDAMDARGLSREDAVERALVLARACLSLQPRDPGAALVAVDQGLAASSGDPRLVLVRAQALLEAGRLDEAERSASRAVALAPESADGHFTRGLVRERRGALDKAHRSFTRTLTLERSHLGARARRAHVLRRLGRLEEARLDLEAYLARVPRDAREWTTLGAICSQLDAHEDALRALRRALEIDPRDVAARFQAVLADSRRRDLESMARSVDDLARVAGDDRRVEWARGLLAADRGALAPAAELLGSAFRRTLTEGETYPESETALVAERLFPILKRTGKAAEARTLFEEALRRGAHSPLVLASFNRSFGRFAARGVRLRVIVRSRGQGDPPEWLARVFEVEAETLDEAWELCFEAERVLGGHGLERGAVLEDHKVTKEEGPILSGLLAVHARVPEEEAEAEEPQEPQGFEPEKGWSPDEEGSGGNEDSGEDGG